MLLPVCYPLLLPSAVTGRTAYLPGISRAWAYLSGWGCLLSTGGFRLPPFVNTRASIHLCFIHTYCVHTYFPHHSTLKRRKAEIMCTPEGRASLLRGQPTPEMALADAIRVLKASLMAQGGGGDQVREGGATSHLCGLTCRGRRAG